MPAVNQQENPAKIDSTTEVIDDKGVPILFGFLRDFRVSISGKVGEDERVGDFEKVDLLRSAGGV